MQMRQRERDEKIDALLEGKRKPQELGKLLSHLAAAAAAASSSLLPARNLSSARKVGEGAGMGGEVVGEASSTLCGM